MSSTYPRVKSYAERLTDILGDAEDLLSDMESFFEELEGHGFTVKSERVSKGCLHKLQEAIGPLTSAQGAAEDAGL